MKLTETVESTCHYADKLTHQRASIDRQEVMLTHLCQRFMPDQGKSRGGGMDFEPQYNPYIENNAILSVGSLQLKNSLGFQKRCPPEVKMVKGSKKGTKMEGERRKQKPAMYGKLPYRSRWR
ncbi:hypothetical protein M9H77_26914 [Catharanthus roseus]|uniref:Uncharacterized protein n=1 Tax=Catharanthus roseus TaxID=4058 RepID=A0ACC0ABI3_CATRO|nr:hypothetical protein M9H77_26914 [Catharanthus roseus]